MSFQFSMVASINLAGQVIAARILLGIQAALTIAAEKKATDPDDYRRANENLAECRTLCATHTAA
jgi:hypothetical protein